jgi:glutamate-1-semialdehyde 2,1-aminomutase
MAWASSRIFRFSARRPQLSIRSQIMHVQSSQSDWITRAQAVLPAGGFGNFDPSIVIREGRSSRVWDEDGREYVDYLIGSGPMILGHGHPEVLEAVLEQLPKGMTFFANNAAGIELAEEICRAVPCAEQLRYVSTGGEADMYAMRLARAFTGRDKILKFEGGYHGMSAEAQMSLAPARLVNFPQAVPDSAGIPEAVRDGVLVAPFNDADFVRSLIAEQSGQIAGIIVEPLQRLIPPAPGFLEALRTECDRHGIVLIFDEIVTGFRFAYGGAQELYGVTPDICTLGKIIGGGFPLAAIAGRADIMAHFDKAKVGQGGFLMQLGTLSGNPVAAIAGLKTLEILRRPGAYESLRQTGQALMELIGTHLTEAGIAHQIVGDPTLFDVIFSERPVRDYRDVLQADAGRNAAFNKALRGAGVFKSPGKLYPSLAIDDQDLEWTDRAVREAAAKIRLA